MAYRVDIDQPAVGTIRALPRHAQIAFAEALALLELTPWAGRPFMASNPGGAIRTIAFGDGGLVVYLVLDDLARVDVLEIQWSR